MNIMIRAPVLGKVHSRSPTAMESATPEERKGLFPCGTGQGLAEALPEGL